jgi:hypothetical protein
MSQQKNHRTDERTLMGNASTGLVGHGSISDALIQVIAMN